MEKKETESKRERGREREGSMKVRDEERHGGGGGGSLINEEAKQLAPPC